MDHVSVNRNFGEKLIRNVDAKTVTIFYQKHFLMPSLNVVRSCLFLDLNKDVGMSLDVGCL